MVLGNLSPDLSGSGTTAQWITAIVTIFTFAIVLYKFNNWRNERKKANLSYQLTDDTNGYGYQALIIRNSGPSEARGIEITLDGSPLNRCRFPVIPHERIENLLPNTEFRYSLLAGTGVSLPTGIALNWSDNFSNNRRLEGSLSYTCSR